MSYFKDMAKKIIINESTLKKAIESQLLEEAGLTKSEVEKIISSTKSTPKISSMTNWWNGMGYDM